VDNKCSVTSLYAQFSGEDCDFIVSRWILR